jgi:hypothetical protein
MFKIKLLTALIGVVAMVAMSAAPADALFKSRNGTSQGQAKIISPTTLTVGGAAGAKVTCQSADGEWHLQSKGQFKEHEVGNKQVATTEGPHLYIKISKWNNCTAEVSMIKVTTGVEVTPCAFQLEEEQKLAGKGTASVITACVVKVLKPECIIEVFAGVESQTEPVNAFLKEVSAENGQNSILGTAAVTGIKGTAKCLEGGFKTGEFKSAKGGLVGGSLELV